MIDETYKIESVDANFLITYFVYQVNFLINGGIEEKKNWNDKIVLTYIISKHAFERWLSRNKDFDFTIRTSPFLKMYKINLLEITNVLGKSEKDGLNRSEEHEKERFHNTLKGLTQCVLTTTLYNHRSKLCVTCNNKDDCKKLLENNYPELYKEREYVASTD